MRHDYLVVVRDGGHTVAVHLLTPAEAGPYVATVRCFWPDLSVSCDAVRLAFVEAFNALAAGTGVPAVNPSREELGFRSLPPCGGKCGSGPNCGSGGNCRSRAGGTAVPTNRPYNRPLLLPLRTDLAAIGAAGFDDEDDDEPNMPHPAPAARRRAAALGRVGGGRR
jgi:hypothetical protein